MLDLGAFQVNGLEEASHADRNDGRLTDVLRQRSLREEYRLLAWFE